MDLASIVAAPEHAKRKVKTSPTQRTLKHLRAMGCELVAVTERWNPHAKIRQDLFGIIDVLAIKGEDIIAVQATGGDGGNVAARVTKMAESDALPHLLRAGIKVYVHGWRKNAAGKWVLREVELS
jgi:hypothetical protein